MVEQARAVHQAATEVASIGGGIPEIPTFITLLAHRWHGHPFVRALQRWENLAFAAVAALVLGWLAWRYGRKPTPIPRSWQNVLETFAELIDTLAQSIVGPEGRRHVPFIGTLFLYLWLMNLSVLIPGFKSATSSLNTTVGMALVVFCYVQWVGLRSQGIVKYLDHLAGSPRDAAGWALLPLMLPIHVLGELVKPLSLSLRLGFNIFAEDVLLAALLGLGLAAGVVLHLPIGLPLQALVIPLVLIFSTVQALVFSLLSTVYIALMSPHEEHGHGAAHAT